MNRKFFIVSLAIILISSLPACSKKDKKNSDVHKFIAKLKMEISKKKEQPIAVKIAKPITYKPSDRHHPFIEKTHISSKRNGNDHQLEYNLQNYKVSELRLVGILHSNKKKWALVETPDGAVYQVTTGTQIGSEGGIITKISPSKIEIKNDMQEITLDLEHYK